MSKLVMAEKQVCKVTLETPIGKVETDTYMLFAKKNGTNMIEINNLEIDEIIGFADELEKLIRNHITDYCK